VSRSKRDTWPDGTLEALANPMLPSLAVGQHEEDTGLRTDGRPVPGEKAPKRSEKVRSMFAPEDVERLDQWAGQRGVSRSTAVALIVRERLKADGF